MSPKLESLKKILNEKKINLSHQRLKVLEYLVENRCHPTVDKIYTDLRKDIATLSKTTVYNTVHMLAEIGLVKVLSIDDNETRYDITTETHGHFQCESCQAVYDFNININQLVDNELESFKINDKNVYFKGVCPKCLANIEKNN